MYQSELHLGEDGKKVLKWLQEKKEDLKELKVGESRDDVCRILMLCADDGVEYSQRLHDLVQGMEYQVIFFGH